MQQLLIGIVAGIGVLLAAFGYGRKVAKDKNKLEALEDDKAIRETMDDTRIATVADADKYLRDRE